MDITANYERTVSNVGEFLGAGYSQSYDVILGIVISESLSNPQMDFTLTIPKGGADIQSMIDYKFNLDPDDKMIQFGAVLLFGQFMTDTDAVLARSCFYGSWNCFETIGWYNKFNDCWWRSFNRDGLCNRFSHEWNFGYF